MMRRILIVLALAAGAVPTASAAPTAYTQQKLTYVDLVGRLTNLEYLATIPAPGETCSQWSSYDRASKYDEATGKYIAWDANGDGQGFIREQDGKILMAEMQGPGCIRRIWSAAPGEGHVRIYLDGASEPAVDLPFTGYFDGTNAPFTRKALCYVAAKGWNCFVPIPYRKSCKIVADKKWGNYFHFTYTTFPKDTQVPTFKRELSPEESAALDAADKGLQPLVSDLPPSRPEQKTETLNGVVKAGGSSPLSLDGGPGAITLIRAKVEDLPQSPEDRAVLRELTLSITWDDDPQPSVWAPLGDFFGTAAGANAYLSFPSGLTKDGWFYSRWFMPFAKKAVIQLGNDGKTDRKVVLEVTRAPLMASIEKLARFHAKWHPDALLPAEPERAIDWTLLKTEGAGRFCGVMLHVWNPRGGWWGEGDEKFFVDGEKFPSTIGTGSEDYFGYAWSNPELFTRPFHDQTISENNAGHICVNRWEIAENVPFQKSFEGCIEKYWPNAKPTLYDCVAYWYLAPGGKDPYAPVPLAERMVWPQPNITRIKGAIEGEKMKVMAKTAGETQVQELSGFGDGWSNSSHLWWTGAKPGAKLDLALGVKKEGKYKLTTQLTKARDYGIVQLYLDDKKVGSPIDLYNPDVVPSGPIDLGTHKLDVKVHKLTFEVVGANPKAAPGYMVGFDYVKVELSSD